MPDPFTPPVWHCLGPVSLATLRAMTGARRIQYDHAAGWADESGCPREWAYVVHPGETTQWPFSRWARKWNRITLSNGVRSWTPPPGTLLYVSALPEETSNA